MEIEGGHLRFDEFPTYSGRGKLYLFINNEMKVEWLVY